MYNLIKRLHTASNGTAMLTVLFFVFIIAIAASGTALMLQGDMFRNRRMVERVKADEIAEGAAEQALGAISEDVTWLFSLPSEIRGGSLGEGTYTVTVQDLANSIAVVIAQGTVGDVTRTVKVYIRYPKSAKGIQVAMFSNHDIRLTGGGSCKENLGGGCHANSNVDISGNVEVYGDASGVGTVKMGGAAFVSGKLIPYADWVEFPKIDFDHYYEIAPANGEVYEAGKKAYLLKGTYNPTGGVLWVVGDVDIATHTVINGALFVTGDIHQAGQCDIYQYEDFPAMASRNGSIHLTGHSDIMEGMIYAASGYIDLTGYHRIVGSLVAWDDIFTRGNWGVVEYMPPDDDDEDDKRIQVLAWEY